MRTLGLFCKAFGPVSTLFLCSMLKNVFVTVLYNISQTFIGLGPCLCCSLQRICLFLLLTFTFPKAPKATYKGFSVLGRP